MEVERFQIQFQRTFIDLKMFNIFSLFPEDFTKFGSNCFQNTSLLWTDSKQHFFLNPRTQKWERSDVTLSYVQVSFQRIFVTKYSSTFTSLHFTFESCLMSLGIIIFIHSAQQKHTVCIESCDGNAKCITQSHAKIQHSSIRTCNVCLMCEQRKKNSERIK